jgi:hypothetical protein
MSHITKLDFECFLHKLNRIVSVQIAMHYPVQFIYIGNREMSVLRSGLPHEKFNVDQCGRITLIWSRRRKFEIEILEVDKESHINIG